MQPKELEQWIGTQYGVSAEYPWAVSPENAVFRHRENKKWFALLLRVAGDKFDEAIISYVKKKYNLLIGERTAENIKMGIGSAYKTGDTEPVMDIKGRNLLNGLPENITVTSEEIREAISEPLSHVIDAIKTTLEKTPPELAADIIESGIMLAGGGALLRGLDQLIHEETGMPVKIAERPLDCVADGTGKVLENIDKLEDVLSEDENIY